MQTQDIRRRIRSVESTQQITRAMKFVAAARLRRAQDAMLAMRPYADALDGLVKHVAQDLVGDEHPLLRPRAQAERAAYVLIAGDRGLAGGFNATLFRAVDAYVASTGSVEPVFIAVGKQATGYLRKSGRRVIRGYRDVSGDLSSVMAGEIGEKLVALHAGGAEERIDEAYVVYNEFASMLTQRPVIRRLLPIAAGEAPERGREREQSRDGGGAVLERIVLEESPDDVFDLGDAEDELIARRGEMEAEKTKAPPRPIYELLPDARTALERLMSRRMAAEIRRGVLESGAAELAARMAAMDSATNNAEEMVTHLTLDLNRARQTRITTELLDIIGGANALE